jgi:tight adherence protein B
MTAIMVFVFLVVLAVVFVAVSLGLRLLETRRRKQVAGVLAAVGGDSVSSTATKDSLLLPSRGTPLPADARGAELWRRCDRLLQQSGLNWTVPHLFFATVALAGAGLFVGWWLRPLGFLWLSLAAVGFLFGIAPISYVRLKRNKRLREIEEQLPEALDFLARSMRAGHAFSISLEMLGRELPDPLGQELRALFNELNLGAPTENAMHNLAARVPLLDVRLFVSSVLLQKQTGGNLSEVLVRLAHIIRERFRLRGQLRVASAHGRLTALVLTLLPLVLVVALLFLAPGYLQSLAADPDGKWMIMGSIGAQALGYIIMRRIVNIKA